MEATTEGSLRVLAALKAARDFGLPADDAAAIAYRYDPQLHGFDRFVEKLACAVEERVTATPRA